MSDEVITIDNVKSIQEIMEEHDGRCVIFNAAYGGLLSLTTGLDSMGDASAVVYETRDYDKWMGDATCIWELTTAPDGYYFKNEREPSSVFYLFRSVKLDEGDYTIYGESGWQEDRRKRSQFGFWPKPVMHGAPPEPVSYYITLDDGSFYGKEYYLKAGVAKNEWGSHYVYATPEHTSDLRDLWFLLPER